MRGGGVQSGSIGLAAGGVVGVGVVGVEFSTSGGGVGHKSCKKVHPVLSPRDNRDKMRTRQTNRYFKFGLFIVILL